MYFLNIKDEDKDLYDTIEVDGKKFYYLKKSSQTKKRRYSDQFRISGFNYKDLYRKLRIMEKHKQDNKDLDVLIEKWKECIKKCIFILKEEFNVQAKDVFNAFNLEKYGFELQEFGEYED